MSLLPLLASAAPASFSTETIHDNAAPVLASSNGQVVKGSYIVVFKKHVSADSASHHHKWVQDVHTESEVVRTELRKRSSSSEFPITTEIFEGLKHTYNIAGDFLGYSGHFDDDVIEKVRRHPDVRIPQSFRLALPISLHLAQIWSMFGYATLATQASCFGVAHDLRT